MSDPSTKPIRMQTAQWQIVRDLADELSEEFGFSFSLPAAIVFAIKFTKDNRPVRGTPDGLGTEEIGHA